MLEQIRVKQWPMGMPKRQVEPRWRRRMRKHGDLVVVVAADLARLVERAELVSRQLCLPLDLNKEVSQ